MTIRFLETTSLESSFSSSIAIRISRQFAPCYRIRMDPFKWGTEGGSHPSPSSRNSSEWIDWCRFDGLSDWERSTDLGYRKGTVIL